MVFARFYILFFMLLYGCSSSAVVTYLGHLKPPHGSLGPDIVLVGDRHEDYQNSILGKMQQNLIIDFAKACNALMFVESLSEYCGDDKAVAETIARIFNAEKELIEEYYQQACEQKFEEGEAFDYPTPPEPAVKPIASLLFGIKGASEKHGARCKNVECRHASEAALAECSFSAKQVFQMTQKIALDCAQELKKLKAILPEQEYKMLAEHAEYVHQLSMDDQKSKFDSMQKSDAEFGGFIEDEVELQQAFAEYECAILDHIILLEIAKNRNEKIIFVVAGSLHTTNVQAALLKLGYRLVAQEGKEGDVSFKERIADIAPFFQTLAKLSSHESAEKKEAAEEKENPKKRKVPTADAVTIMASTSSTSSTSAAPAVLTHETVVKEPDRKKTKLDE